MIGRRALLAAGGLAAALIVSPLPARAHVAIAGADDFTAGLLHPFFVLSHLLVIAGLGLLLAQQSLAHVKAAVPAFTACLLAGFLCAGLALEPPVAPRGALLGTALAAGLLVALGRPLPRALPAALAAIAGLAIGFDSVPEDLALWPTLLAMTGTGLSVSLLLINLVALGGYARRPWQVIGLRVLGSWIGACSLMVSALALR